MTLFRMQSNNIKFENKIITPSTYAIQSISLRVFNKFVFSFAIKLLLSSNVRCSLDNPFDYLFYFLRPLIFISSIHIQETAEYINIKVKPETSKFFYEYYHYSTFIKSSTALSVVLIKEYLAK